MSEFYFIVSILAVWRLTYMIIDEDGPYGIFARLQAWAWNKKAGEVGTLKQGLTCFYCLSVWVAIPFSIMLVGLSIYIVPITLALSGGAILFDKLHSMLTVKS